MIVISVVLLLVSPNVADTPTLAIVLGFAGTVVTAICGAAVAVSLNKSEKKQTAETALEKALRERIILRDEELADVRGDLQDAEDQLRMAEERVEKLTVQRDRLYLAIVEQRAEEKIHNGES